jgi:hypothetical protein
MNPVTTGGDLRDVVLGMAVFGGGGFVGCLAFLISKILPKESN